MTGRWLGPLLVAAIVGVSGWTDVNRYFNQQMHDAAVFAEHSAGPTFAARELAALPAGTRVLMDERLTGEPTIAFLAPNAPKHEGYETHLLPLTDAVPTAVFLGGDQQADADYLRRLYPRAAIKAFASPYGGPTLLYEAQVPADDIRAIQGPPAVALDAPEYGDYGFQVEGDAELSLDGQSLPTGQSAVQVRLARGVHQLALKGAGQILWRPPSSRELGPIPAEDLYSSPTVQNGLLGRYYPNRDWAGPPGLEEVDPFVAVYYQVTPLPMPFSVEWTGQLAAPVAGTYRFDATSIDSSRIEIDGAVAPKQAPVPLSAGLHDVRLRYEAHSGHNHVEFRWQPPGGEWQVVPSTFLFPSKSVGEAQPMPELPGRAEAASRGPAASTQAPKLLAPDWQAAFDEDGAPAGLTLDAAGNVLVVDGRRRTLTKLDPNGQRLWAVGAPGRTAGFGDLAAVAVTRDGSILTLDGDSGVLSRFTPDGQYAGVFAKDLALYHPRGLAVAPNGDVYVADTGGSRVVHLDPDGRLIGAIGVRGTGRGGLDQPTGVGVGTDGSVLVVDPAAQKVVRFAPAGGVAAEWGFDSGPTVAGPQVALAPDGKIWISDPEAGAVQAFTSDGKPLGSYAPDGGLDQPSGLAAGDGYLIVAEPGGHAVRKLSLPAPASPPAAG